MEDNSAGLLVLLLWLFIATRVAKKKKVFRRKEPFEIHYPIVKLGFLSFFSFILYLFIQGSSIPLAKWGMEILPPHEAFAWATNFTMVIATVTLISFTLPATIRRFVWGISNPCHKLLKGAFWWFLAYPTALLFAFLVNLLVEFFVDFSPSLQIAVVFLQNLKENSLLFAVTTFTLVILAPLSEEILFRGFLFTFLKKILPFKGALILSAFIFALFHFDPEQGYTNYSLLMALWILGMFLGWVYERERSLWSSIGLHAFFNFVSTINILLEGI